jgi:glucuronate isomerase
LCNLLGSEIEKGELPRDLELVGSMVKDICFGNAKGYLGLELPSKVSAQVENAVRA